MSLFYYASFKCQIVNNFTYFNILIEIKTAVSLSFNGLLQFVFVCVREQAQHGTIILTLISLYQSHRIRNWTGSHDIYDSAVYRNRLHEWRTWNVWESCGWLLQKLEAITNPVDSIWLLETHAFTSRHTQN